MNSSSNNNIIIDNRGLVLSREFKDVVFEDVVFDSNSFVTTDYGKLYYYYYYQSPPVITYIIINHHILKHHIPELRTLPSRRGRRRVLAGLSGGVVSKTNTILYIYIYIHICIMFVCVYLSLSLYIYIYIYIHSNIMINAKYTCTYTPPHASSQVLLLP